MNKIITIIFIVCVVPSMVCATDRYVDATCAAGSDYDDTNRTQGSGGGKISYQTIAAGVAAMSGGDTLYIRGGTYSEAEIDCPSSKNGTAEAYTTICSYPGEWAIIDGSALENGSKDWIIGHWGFSNDGSSSTAYWKFERLELTGAHNTGDVMTAGIFISGGPHIMRYLYIHDNLANNVEGNSENPGGIVGIIWNDCIVEYCYFKDNGTENETNEMHSVIGIQIHTDYNITHPECGPCGEYYAHNNTYRYNLFVNERGRAQGGIHDKSAQYLSPRLPSRTWTNQEIGNKIHHNIFINIQRPIGCQMDFSQIHHNITSGATIGIEVHDPNTIQGGHAIVVYNNTLKGGGRIVAHFGSSAYWYDPWDDILSPYIYWYNNLQDQSVYGDELYPMNVGTSYIQTPYPNYSADRTVISNNFMHSPANEDHIKVTRDSGDGLGVMSLATFDGFNSTTNYSNSTAELWKDESGADQYMANDTFVIGETTIANGGIGGSHPYLSGVTLPSYVGAVNPSDSDWVAGVLGLNSTTWLQSTTTDRDSNDDPTWIEGSGSSPAASNSGVSGSGVSNNGGG